MSLLKFLFNKKQKGEVRIGGKSMEQRLREYDIRTQRERMKRYPENYRHGGQMALSFE